MIYRMALAIILFLFTSSCQDTIEVQGKRSPQQLDDRTFYYARASDGLLRCPSDWTPDYPDMPDKPFIPDSVKGDREAEEKLLINNINELRENIRQLQAVIKDYPAKYSHQCYKYPFTL